MTLQTMLLPRETLATSHNNTTGREIVLRSYQLDALGAVLEKWYGQGEWITMLALATGVGKTETFLGVLARELAEERLGRALILAHRKELVEQPRNRIASGWCGRLPLAGIVMGEQNEASAQIVCATYQTLRSERRMAELLSYGEFSHLVIDECHHTAGDSYLQIIDTLKQANPDLKVLGVTATPNSEIKPYQSIAYRINIRRAVQELKCLVEPVGLGIHLDLNLKGIRTRGDDFREDELAAAMESSQCEKVVYETWKQHAADRPTMCFATSVAHARMLADYFHFQGVPVGFASGETPKEEREGIIRRYMNGEVHVLFNCNVWTEGFDAPHTSAILMVRPTLSPTFYIQAVGRGLRLFEGKDNCLILDFKPDTEKNLMDAGMMLGRSTRKPKEVEKAIESGVLVSVDTLDELNQGDLGIDEELPKIVVRVLDLLGNKSKFKWTFDGVFSSCSVDENRTIVIVHPQPDRVAAAEAMKSKGQWSPAHDLLLKAVSSYQVFELAKRGEPHLLSRSEDYEPAHQAAEAYLADNGGTLASKSSSWRSKDPSPALINFATKLGVYEPGANAGKLSQAITHRLCRNRLLSAGIIR